MHRLFAPFLAIAVLLAVLAPVPGHAADADNKGIKLDFDGAVLQRMSAFVSAFAEVDPQGRWHQIDDASQADPEFLVTFGVLHNWMHNAAAFAVDGGQASIDAAAVASTIEEYTGLKFDSHAAVPESGIGFADGRYAIAADTPREGPQAVVVNVYATPDNGLLMVGHAAGKQAAGGAQVNDDLQVRVAHHTFKGKDCWKLISWSWAGKPVAKPAETVVEQPAEQRIEQPAAQPAEQAVEGTDQTAEQPKAEGAPEAQPEPVAEPAPADAPAGQPETGNAPVVEPVPADKPAEAADVKPETEATPAQENESQSAPEAKPEPQIEPEIVAPEAQPATESQPAVEPAVTPAEQPLEQPAEQPSEQPAEQPVEQPAPESTPATQSEPETPPAAQPAPDVVPAPQPDEEPVAQTIIPFTASTEPDFSEVLAVAVPTGWNHRNAEGVLELTPDAQDAWLVVEAVRLGARDPQKALKLFSGGAVLTPFGTSGASYIFTSEGRTGHREHMIVVDADANLICRVTWQASESHREAIAAILHGLRVNGRAVAG